MPSVTRPGHFPYDNDTVMPPQGRLSSKEFVDRCQGMRCSSRPIGSPYGYDPYPKRENPGYTNYYAPYDNAYRHRDTGDLVWLYCPPDHRDLTEECREEAAVTISKVFMRDLRLVQQWLGMYIPDTEAYLREWLDDPCSPLKYKYYNEACRRQHVLQQDVLR